MLDFLRVRRPGGSGESGLTSKKEGLAIAASGLALVVSTSKRTSLSPDKATNKTCFFFPAPVLDATSNWPDAATPGDKTHPRVLGGYPFPTIDQQWFRPSELS